MALAGIAAVTRALAVSAAVTMALAVEQASMVMVLPSMDHRGSMLVEEEVSPLAGKETSSLERPVARLVTHATMGTGNTPMRSSELILGSSTEYRNNGGSNSDAGVQSGTNLAGISPDLINQAMQGVVAALAAAAQKGGAEGVSASVLGDAVSAATQTATPMVQQSQVVTIGSQQVLPMQVDAGTMPKNDIPNPAKKAKKADKNPCFRCKQPGHQIDTCTVPVCDICESTNHISSACPLLQAPKPSVTMYGYAIEQLMFFEIPTGGAYKPKVDNVKLVKVTVEGDPMSIPEIAECLRRIVPVENFQWEIYNFQNNVFRVKFPNKSEAQRMKAFRTYPVPDRASDLIFEDWSALEDPLYMLPEVWLRVRGIPANVRTDFLSLWAVGTLFGKTKEVDMVHTRKNKELRLRIGCLDHTLIPETTDVFIQRGFFKLSFEVEQVIVTQLGTDDMGNNGDNNGGGGNNGANGDNVDGAKDMDIERTMNNDQQGNANNQQGTVKKVNNAKSVVAHQVQHLVEVPMVLGSLNKALLNKDTAPAGEPRLAADHPSIALSADVTVAAAAADTPPAGERRLAADQPCTDPKLKTSATGQTAACRAPLGDRGVAAVLLGGDPAVVALAQPASPAPTQRKLTPVGPAIDAVGQQVLNLGSGVAFGSGSSVNNATMDCAVASMKNTAPPFSGHLRFSPQSPLSTDGASLPSRVSLLLDLASQPLASPSPLAATTHQRPVHWHLRHLIRRNTIQGGNGAAGPRVSGQHDGVADILMDLAPRVHLHPCVGGKSDETSVERIRLLELDLDRAFADTTKGSSSVTPLPGQERGKLGRGKGASQ
ncbi:hypothetical protein ACQ4PT_014862 [Festuca glaucescens]